MIPPPAFPPVERGETPEVPGMDEMLLGFDFTGGSAGLNSLVNNLGDATWRREKGRRGERLPAITNGGRWAVSYTLTN